MYRKHVQHPEFESFFLPFGGHLDSDNRWVRMAKLIPWAEVEQRYEKLFADSGMGALAKNVRIALGALIGQGAPGTFRPGDGAADPGEPLPAVFPGIG